MTPSPIGTYFPSPTRQKIPDAQRNDHEKIAGEVVTVDECSGHRVDQAFPLQVEDLSVTAEKFKDSIERFPNTDCHDDHYEWPQHPVAICEGPPIKEKEEEPDEGQPFEKLDLGNEGDERKGKAQS